MDLEQMYSGFTQTIPVHVRVICPSCNGTGKRQVVGREQAECTLCHGAGGTNAPCPVCGYRNWMGPRRYIGAPAAQGTLANYGEAPLPVLPAEGASLRPAPVVRAEDDRCERCRGMQVVTDTVMTTIVAERGVDKGHRITFEEAANQHPGFVPGDLVLVVVQIPHARFVRKGANLVHKRSVHYEEAVRGFTFKLAHLDGRTIDVDIAPRQVSPPVTSHVISSEGMPLYGSPHLKGDLYIIFSVDGAPPLPEGGPAQLSLDEFWRMLREES